MKGSALQPPRMQALRLPRGPRARDPGGMEIEVLVVPGCPDEQTVADRLRQALDDLGLRETGFTRA